MLRIVIYGPDGTENRRIRDLLEDILNAAEIKLVYREFAGKREPFLTYVRRNPYLVMLVVQTGPAGAETVQLAKDANPNARLIWFSDHDYALFAYGLHLTFFGLLPVNRHKAQSALDACWYATGPPGIRSFGFAQPTPFSQS